MTSKFWTDWVYCLLYVIFLAGEGAYSSVYLVRRISDSIDYALKKVKMVDLSDKEKINALNEVRILASLNHPCVISYKEAFFDEPTSSLWYSSAHCSLNISLFPSALECSIIMEYCDGGDLYQRITQHQKRGTNFTEAEIWRIFIQVLFCSFNVIAHPDSKRFTGSS